MKYNLKKDCTDQNRLGLYQEDDENVIFYIPKEFQSVSREHAFIEVNDHGEWWLEDLDSTHGTYIRNEDGEFKRCGRQRINESSFICLGTDDSNGFSFYAHMVKDYDKNNSQFTKDFLILKEKNEEFKLQRQKLKEKIRYIKVTLSVSPAIVFFFILSPYFSHLLGEYSVAIRCLISVCSMSVSTLYDGPERIREFEKGWRNKWNHCPNPKCSYKLKSEDIDNMRCPKCHQH